MNDISLDMCKSVPYISSLVSYVNKNSQYDDRENVLHSNLILVRIHDLISYTFYSVCLYLIKVVSDCHRITDLYSNHRVQFQSSEAVLVSN